MAEVRLSNDQRAAVEHRGGALLVSAAAGSGKTKVLVERLLSKVCDPDQPRDLSEFLIITYTKAAAAELRSKIAKEIGERLAGGANAHLRRQITQLYIANISTVHSFCSEILREYAYRADIPSDFRIAEETECEPLRAKAMDLALDEAYREISQSDALTAFFSTLGNKRDDRDTSRMILDLYFRAQCHPNPEQWLKECETAVSLGSCETADETVWAKSLLEQHKKRMAHIIAQTNAAIQIVNENDELQPYFSALQSDLALYTQLASAQTLDALYALHGVKFERLGSVNQCTCPEEKHKVQTIRNNCKAAVQEQQSIFSLSSEDAYSELKATGSALCGLIDLTRRFTDHYTRVKRSRRVLDFQDLEHAAISLLTDRQGNPTSAAKEVASRYCEIMVDEYQDSNEVQDLIFRAVSNGGNNLFFVGDVKQSIYSFRLADPTIFLKKYDAFAITPDPNYQSGRKILLSQNFRSSNAVLDAANHVFSKTMSKEVGDLDYTSDVALYPGRQEQSLLPNFAPIQLHLIETKNKETKTSANKYETEARFVAGQILALLDHGEIPEGENGAMRRVQPQDIAILMRSPSKSAPIYTRVLAQYGIAVSSDMDSDILETTEVLTLLSFLQILQNPHQDVPLVTAMASPIGGFSADELAQIRAADRNSDLYDALLVCAKTSKRHAQFVEELASLRAMRSRLRLEDLIDAVCRSLGFYTVFGAMLDGDARVRNIRCFCDLVQGAQTAGCGELGSFLRYVEQLQQGKGVKTPPVGEEQTVKLLSVHKSKGLEYPIVFLCDLSHGFNRDALKAKVLAEPNLYLGSSVMDSKLMAAYPSIAKEAIKQSLIRASVSEEMRVLYVAMTRPKHALIMTYCASGADTKVGKIAESATDPLMPGVAQGVSCIGDWVLYAAALRPEAEHVFGGAQHSAGLPGKWLVQFHDASQLSEKRSGEDAHKRISMPQIDLTCTDHSYAFTPATVLPAKLTATQLKGSSLDAESAERAEMILRKHPPEIMRRPFASKEITAADRGTAIHRFLQFCRYDACDTAESVQREAQRLTDRAFITPEQAQQIDAEKIARFFSSEFGRHVSAQAALQREFKFSLLVDAKTFLPDAPDEQVMLQGVVDCFWEEENGLSILDYKTDRIRAGGEAERAEFYRAQLDAYRLALERIYQKPVKKRLLYFFETGTVFEL